MNNKKLNLELPADDMAFLLETLALAKSQNELSIEQCRQAGDNDKMQDYFVKFFRIGGLESQIGRLVNPPKPDTCARCGVIIDGTQDEQTGYCHRCYEIEICGAEYEE